MDTATQFVPKVALFGIACYLGVFYLRRTPMTKNRWFLMCIGILAIIGLIYPFWDVFSHVFLMAIGIALILLVIIGTIFSHPAQPERPAVARPLTPSRVWNKENFKKVWAEIRRVFIAAVAGGMIYMIFTDNARPIVSAEVWRTIATLWFVMASILYIEIIRKRKKELRSSSLKSEEQVSEHVVKHVQAIDEQLQRVTFNSYGYSLKAIFAEILADRTVSAWYKDKPILEQAIKAFNRQLDEPLNRLHKFSETTKKVTPDNVVEIYNEARSLIFNYRIDVSEFIKMLNNWGKEGAPPIWETEPLSGRIYRDLRDGYDELVRLVRDLKIYSTDDTKSLLTPDGQLTKFEYIEGVLDWSKFSIWAEQQRKDSALKKMKESE